MFLLEMKKKKKCSIVLATIDWSELSCFNLKNRDDITLNDGREKKIKPCKFLLNSHVIQSKTVAWKPANI